MKRLLIAILLLIPTVTFADGERERLAIISARVRYGISKRPKSPDAPPNIRTINVPGPKKTTSVAPETEPVVPLEPAPEPVKSVAPDHMSNSPYGPPPIRLSFNPEAASVADSHEPYEVICGVASWCKFCPPAEKRVGKGDQFVHVQYVDIDQPKPDWMDAGWWRDMQIVRNRPHVTLPFWTYYDGKGSLRYLKGAGTTSKLLKERIEDPVNDPPPKKSVGYGTASSAGAIHGAGTIHGVFDWIDTHVGQGVPMEFKWGRTGKQALNLMQAGKEWTFEDIFGQSGMVSTSAKGAINLPVDSLGFTYRVDGNDLLIDADSVRIKEVAKKLGLTGNDEAMGVAPGMDPITAAWTAISVIRMVWSVLHPSADLRLGGNVTATGVLKDGVLTVKFKDMPSIRLVALFTFNLGVSSVEMTTSNVRVHFTGSRWITYKDFRVTDDPVPASSTPPLSRDPEPKSSVKVPVRRQSAPPGWHSHRCPDDGTTWFHSAASYGSVNDHRCPNCGRLQWTVYQQF